MMPKTTRRNFMKSALAGGLAISMLPSVSKSQDQAVIRNPIPSSGELVPAVGLGSWITFNVGNDPVLLDACTEVMKAFFEAGGTMIDSSPMYGSSQATIGYGLSKLNRTNGVFSAEKVWTRYADEGRDQISKSAAAWNLKNFDLMQVHNLVAWRDHLETLKEMKEAGQIRYIGITTSHGRRHEELAEVMRMHKPDFVQLTYNPVDRDAEHTLLPLAQELGIAVIVNRPFRGGPLVRKLSEQGLPAWVNEFGITSWAQLVLKYILSNPAVTCAIPATTRVNHVKENLAAARLPLLDENLRERISREIADA